MKYILAVSGGVDSVVLLDMLVKKSEHELTVAHFDHGIRNESAADARFVEALARRYGLTFETKREELGTQASEATARERRYAFLRSLAQKYDAKVVTAHHQDDVIETIAINLIRGTGWRGLAVLNNSSIERPLLNMTKRDIYDYAVKHELEWVEDETNKSRVYLRNRVRYKTGRLSKAVKNQLLELWRLQRGLCTEIDAEIKKLPLNSRYFLTMVDETSASEAIRAFLLQHNASLTRPQRIRLLHAIKTAKPGDHFEAGQGITVQFNVRDYIVKLPL